MRFVRFKLIVVAMLAGIYVVGVVRVTDGVELSSCENDVLRVTFNGFVRLNV